MAINRIFPRVYNGAEKLRIVYDAMVQYSIEVDRRFTAPEISEFIFATSETYISPPGGRGSAQETEAGAGSVA